MELKDLSCLNDSEKEQLTQCSLTGIRFYAAENRLEMDLHTPETIPCALYTALRTAIEDTLGITCTIHVKADSCDVSQQTIQDYIEEICRQDTSFLAYHDVIFTVDPEAGCLCFLFEKEEDCHRAEALEADLSNALADLGITGYGIRCQFTVVQPTEVETVIMDAVPESAETVSPKKRRKNNYRIRMQDYTQIRLEDVQFPVTDVQFTGDIFKEEITETKTGRHIQALSVYDGTDAITVKRFEGRAWTLDDMKEVGPGDRVRFFGNVENDNYSHELTFIASYVEKQEKEKLTRVNDI